MTTKLCDMKGGICHEPSPCYCEQVKKMREQMDEIVRRRCKEIADEMDRQIFDKG